MTKKELLAAIQSHAPRTTHHLITQWKRNEKIRRTAARLHHALSIYVGTPMLPPPEVLPPLP